MNQYVPPKYGKDAFNCPHCGAFSHQVWLTGIKGTKWNTEKELEIEELDAACCVKCKNYSLWKIDLGGYERPASKVMIFPDESSIENPNLDIPDDIKVDYYEARSIINKSPRGTVALLRLCIQKMCVHFGLTGKNLNEDIAKLVKDGLPVKIQQALDIVRVIGNEAVHPGQLDLKDDIETANKLFKLVNLIAYHMITEPKEIDTLFEEKISDSKKKAIEDRDKSTIKEN